MQKEVLMDSCFDTWEYFLKGSKREDIITIVCICSRELFNNEFVKFSCIQIMIKFWEFFCLVLGFDVLLAQSTKWQSTAHDAGSFVCTRLTKIIVLIQLTSEYQKYVDLL